MGILVYILEVSQYMITPRMSIDVDNGLPGNELWFGTEEKNEVCLLYHMYTCAAINTGNLAVRPWLNIT